KRDRLRIIRRKALKLFPRRRRPRFSFFSSSIVKKQTTISRHKNSTPNHPVRQSISISANF
ncbi:hypothetical protein, partial [Ciceribacter selenitireducens]